jgi:hypothetical protein
MTAAKAKITESAQDQTGFSRNRSVAILKTILEIIKAEII